MPKFHKQQYEAIAAACKGARVYDDYNGEQCIEIKDLIEFFKKDNPNFKSDKFKKACQ